MYECYSYQVKFILENLFTLIFFLFFLSCCMLNWSRNEKRLSQQLWNIVRCFLNRYIFLIICGFFWIYSKVTNHKFKKYDLEICFQQFCDHNTYKFFIPYQFKLVNLLFHMMDLCCLLILFPSFWIIPYSILHILKSNSKYRSWILWRNFSHFLIKNR